MILPTATIETPVGLAWICLAPRGVCALGLGPRGADLGARVLRRFPGARLTAERDPDGVASRVAAYFRGERALDDVALDLGGTPFQARVWSLLRAVPLGARATYSEIAARLGAKAAVRAVARANATNPASLVVPCHRIVGKDGGLRGYAWGEDRKAWLLAHEATWGSTIRERIVLPQVASSVSWG